MSRTTTADHTPVIDVRDDSPSVSNTFIRRGTPPFIRVTLALFSAGLATFALLYCVQPILPVLSHEFGVSPAQSSISLSVSTATASRSAGNAARKATNRLALDMGVVDVNGWH